MPDIAGETLSRNGLAKIRKANIDKLPLVRGNPRLGACVGDVGHFIAIGLNYADHAAETGIERSEGADDLQQGADAASAGPTTTP